MAIQHRKGSKRLRAIHENVEPGKQYPVLEAIKLIQSFPAVKFVESVDVSINLGIDAKKSDQGIRGATVMPNGTGKKVRVAVFAQGDAADAARAAGAEIVGYEDLAASIQKGQLDFDVVIAAPDTMPVVGKLGQVLGPRGLMPNPKVGTVTADVAGAVKQAKAGQVRYRSEKAGIVHCTIGKVSFGAEALKENLEALLTDIQRVKPSSAKGTYIKKITMSTTMGAGLAIDKSTLASISV